LFDALDNRDIIIKENFLEVSQLEKDNIKIMARNREAYHEYFVEEELEAGIELCGTEVKSIRLGNINMKDSWCGIKNGEMIVNQLHIAPYEQGNIFNRDSKRPRRLLLHKREIMRLFGKVKQDGYSIIPLSIYLKGSLVKVKIGLCKGKKLYDKRQAAAEKDAKRQIDRAMKERY
jgi:SsrA-binding protein